MTTFKPLNPILRNPIATIDDAKTFIKTLVEEGIDWHYEDCAVDCLHETTPHITREDAEFLNSQRDRLYDFDWGPEFECPIGYALDCHGFTSED